MMLENILDYLRITLYVLLVFLVFLLFQAWNNDHPPVQATQAVVTPPSDRYVPTEVVPSSTHPSVNAASTHPGNNVRPPSETAPQSQWVSVSTDVMTLRIDTAGGDIVQSKLLDYPESLSAKTPFILLNDDPKTRYIAESGLLSKAGPDTSQGQAHYTTDKKEYTLPNGASHFSVRLTWQNASGLKINKLFTFTRGSYDVLVTYEIDNQTNEPWEGSLYTQIMRTNVPPASSGGFVNLATYFGAAISTPAKPFEKISFKDMQGANLNRVSTDGWAAMIQHYFISAWVPPNAATSTYYSRATPEGLYTIGMIGQPFTVAPHKKASTSTKFYNGPAIADELEKAAPGLKLTIDYGWFWFISGIIFWLMQKIYDVVRNWGWSIVIVTILIKILFYQLSAKSYRSMTAMKKLQPRIELLKERYGDDKQKLTQATLELYKQEKVNPMSGCLPILIQIPVFIALYWVLVESVQLRQAPFILWIHDLSQPDQYYILPLLMGLSMFLQQRLNPPPPDPLQAKVMMLMPVIFTVLFANFPSGLMLYWFVNNTLSFLQQWYIMHRMNQVSGVKNA